MTGAHDLVGAATIRRLFTPRRIPMNIAPTKNGLKFVVRPAHVSWRSASSVSAMTQSEPDFPTVLMVEGGMAEDHEHVLLQLLTVERGPIQFSLRLADLESFVTFLLRMAASARAAATVEDRRAYEPIPISGVSAGELADGMGCLGVTVGGTELMFQIPTAAIGEVARTLMMVGVDERSQRP